MFIHCYYKYNLLDPTRLCHRCQLRYVFVRLPGPPDDPIKMNPIKPLYDGNISFTLHSKQFL